MRYLESVAIAFVIASALGGCSGESAIGPSPSRPAGLPGHPPTRTSQTFDFTGSKQTFQVPTGVTRITITAMGASGAVGIKLDLQGFHNQGQPAEFNPTQRIIGRIVQRPSLSEASQPARQPNDAGGHVLGEKTR